MPDQLGRYQVQETLGRGAMGVVYKGYDPLIARSVALKTIRRDLLDNEHVAESIGRFRNEAMASGRLNHPGIIAIHEYGETDDTVFIVMEYAPGDNLGGYLRRRQSIKLTEISDMMVQLLDALDYAHENGIVHRDVKPGNIIVGPGGRIKVTDFGIARINTSTLTQTGMIMGTPSYMAPEQYVGLAVDRRADVFSAGIVLYELLTGVKPFEGPTHTVAYKICHEAHLAPSQVNIDLPGTLDAVVARALAKKPEERYATAREFRLALRAVIDLHEARALEPTLVRTYSSSAPTVSAAHDSSSLKLTGWEPGALASLESLMAPFAGPLARTLVKRYAARAFNLAELQQKLSLTIDDLPERAAFIKASQPLFEQLARQMSADPRTKAAAIGATVPGVRQDDIDRATGDLVGFLGPIARVLVKKAAAQARDRRELYSRLAEHLSNADEKAAFLKTGGL